MVSVGVCYAALHQPINPLKRYVNMTTLYHFPVSQHSRRVVSLLEEAQIPYTGKLVDLMSGEHMSAEFLAINPNHQVPTLIDGDVTLHESNAILRYLCNQHNLEQWYPTAAAHRAQVDQWLDWNQCRFSPTIVSIILNKVFLKENGDQAAIKKGLAELPELLDILESSLVGMHYLAGDSPTIADLSVASNIFHLGFADLLPNSSNIETWYGKVSALSGFQKSLPPEM